jgi:hypothetical protein
MKGRYDFSLRQSTSFRLAVPSAVVPVVLF